MHLYRGHYGVSFGWSELKNHDAIPGSHLKTLLICGQRTSCGGCYVQVADNLLTIRGEKKNEREAKNKDYHLVERNYGSFSRTVELHSNVKVEDITAEMANGVLKVTVQKPVSKQVKQIEIKTAA